MNITFPTNTTEVIDAIRSGIGRPVTFYTVTKSGCPACSIDPVTNTSTNSFCTVCSGVGYILTYSGYTIPAHVTHNPAEMLHWVVGGQFVDGDCRIQIKYTEQNQNIVDSAIYVVIDSTNYEIKKQMRRGFRQINRILIDCKEKG